MSTRRQRSWALSFSLAAVAACAADPATDPCDGPKCDDLGGGDDGIPGAITNIELARCTLTPQSGGAEANLACKRLPFVTSGLPVAELRLVADGAEPLVVDFAQGLEQVIPWAEGSALTVELVLDRQASDAERFIGLRDASALRWRTDLGAAEGSAASITLPFDLWPVQVRSVDGALALAVEDYRLDDAESSASLAVTGQTIDIAAGSAERVFLPVLADTQAVRLDSDSGHSLAIEGPRHWLFEDATGFRPERFEDSLAQYCVPPSIMMHSKDVDRLRDELIPWLADHGYTPITYADYARILDGKQLRPQRPVILSIDDVPTEFIRSQFKAMVADLLDAGMVASLAVNTVAPPSSTNPNHMANWELLRTWQVQGISLESHGSEHFNLRVNADAYLGGHKASWEKLRYLIEDSINWLAQATAARPVALITPFGIPDPTTPASYALVREFAERAGARMIVGIPGGRSISPQTDAEGNILFISEPAFVGRVEIQTRMESTAFEIENWYRNAPECKALEIAPLAP